LKRRADYRAGPPWQLFRTALAFAPHRVVWADLARRLAAALPAADVVPMNTVYGIATRTWSDAAALAGLLNSRWYTALACPPAEPLALLLGAQASAAPAAVAARAARALLDLPEVPGDPLPWLTPHQRPAAERLTAVIARQGGAVLADAVGLGKSYVALAVARM